MQPWTVDAIAHALPHPELRQTFMRQVNLTPLPDLPAVLDKWVRFVGEWEAGQPEIEELRAYALEHDGQLPPEHQETPESVAGFEDWEQRMAALKQGHSAA